MPMKEKIHFTHESFKIMKSLTTRLIIHKRNMPKKAQRNVLATTYFTYSYFVRYYKPPKYYKRILCAGYFLRQLNII